MLQDSHREDGEKEREGEKEKKLDKYKLNTLCSLESI